MCLTSIEEYERISNAAAEILLQIRTTYMCEQSFSSLFIINNIKLSCRNDEEFRVALSEIEPNVQRLCLLKKHKYRTELNL